jgi:hypothetical protein
MFMEHFSSNNVFKYLFSLDSYNKPVKYLYSILKVNDILLKMPEKQNVCIYI